MSCKTGLPVVIASSSHAAVASGGVLPVKLDITSREEDEEVLHVARITPLTLAQAQAEQRVTIKVDAKGVVLAASEAPAALFGFKPAALLGHSLAGFVDVFRADPGLDVGAALRALLERWGRSCCCDVLRGAVLRCQDYDALHCLTLSLHNIYHVLKSKV
jgi:hypothetical protein